MIEYKIIRAKRNKRFQERLNELAEDGWRVVCSCIVGKRIVLKRAVREEEG